MKIISVTRAAAVPGGKFCAKYSERDSERCEQVRTQTTHVSWEDGLGSPGTMTFYSCALFDVGLRQVWDKGLSLEKCQACIDAALEGK